MWRYTPPAGTSSINGGTWSLVGTASNILPTPPSPSQYLSLHAIGAVAPARPCSLDQVTRTGRGIWARQFSADRAHDVWRRTRSEPQYYLNNMSGLMPELHTSTNPVLVPANVYRTPDGVAVQWFDGLDWEQLGPPPTSGCPVPGNEFMLSVY